MSDQCANCDVRGHFDKCEGVECGHHENWYPNELKKQLAAAEQRAETLKDERDMYDARATEYWEDVLELSDKLEDAEQRAEKAEKRVDDLSCSTSGMEKLLAEIAKRAGVEDGDVDGLIEWAEKAEQAEKDLAATMVEVAEILHNRQAKIEALKTAERNAVRECERIASRHIANAQHVAYQIRNRYPQHFEEE